MRKHTLLRFIALMISTVPPLICTALYFPVWSVRGDGAVLSGLGLILALISGIPAYRFIKAHLGGISAPFLWFVIFAVFFALENIAHEVTVIAFIGFTSNLIGAFILWLSRRGEVKNEGKRI